MIEEKQVLMTIRERPDNQFEVHYRSMDGSPLFASLLETALVDSKKKVGEFLTYVFEDSRAVSLLESEVVQDPSAAREWNVSTQEKK